MRVKIYLLLVFLILPFCSAMTFTENTKFSDKNVNYMFTKGFTIDSFQIVSDGLLINDNKKFVFVVPGGDLDVNFYNNGLIGLRTSAEQDITFKITEDNKKQYLQVGDNYFMDQITIGPQELNVTPVFYKSGQTEFSNTIVKTVGITPWYQKSIVAFEYDVKQNANGVIESKTFKLTYLWTIFILIILILIFWWTRK